jgi:hypothetical protein
MMTELFRRSVDHRRHSSQGWLMYAARHLAARLARPRFLYPGELSPHLLRDIGLCDSCMPEQRPRS